MQFAYFVLKGFKRIQTYVLRSYDVQWTFYVYNLFLQGIQFTQENNRIRCLAHIVNLNCQAAIDKLEKIACEQAMEVDSDPDLEDADRFSEGVITKVQ